MNKLFISVVAMLFAASLSFAQNANTTTQTGNDNVANSTQTGNNVVEVIQVGNSQNATSTQNGNNTGGVYQLNKGNKNVAVLSQDGSNNQGWITQGMTKDYWEDYQSVAANWNNASITQVGSSNSGSLEQYGGSNSTNGNTANLYQNGSNNTAYGYQGWAYSGYGETSTTSQLQSYNSTVNITQINDKNYAAVFQYGGNSNNASVSQNGNSNVASITQGFIYTDFNYTFTTPVYNTKNNNAYITQAGDNNHGKVMQLGSNNSFNLSQSQGSSVGYDASVSGLLNVRDAYFHQDGNNNQFNGSQTDGAKLDAVSEGISGYFGSFQKGNGNNITLIQDNGNAIMQQLGNYNTAALYQGGGNSNNAKILQNGNSNFANVIQQ